mgnify:CR=1 FL=1
MPGTRPVPAVTRGRQPRICTVGHREKVFVLGKGRDPRDGAPWVERPSERENRLVGVFDG